MVNYNLHKQYFSKEFCSDLITNYKSYFTFEPRPGWNSWTVSDDSYKQLLLKEIENIVPDNLISSWINISVYEPGYFLKLHTDSRSEYTVVVNLNDDYQGGKFLLEHKTLDLNIGDLLAFNGGEINHGVETVLGSTRYSLNFWFTSDTNKVEIKPVHLL